MAVGAPPHRAPTTIASYVVISTNLTEDASILGTPHRRVMVRTTHLAPPLRPTRSGRSSHSCSGEAVAQRECGGRGPIVRARLGQNRTQMISDGAFAEHELFGDLAVGSAL